MRKKLDVAVRRFHIEGVGTEEPMKKPQPKLPFASDCLVRIMGETIPARYLTTLDDRQLRQINDALKRRRANALKAQQPAKPIDDRYCWLGFSDRRECPNMCAGRLCGYAKS
jgi:hypothetical protein